MLQDVCPGEQNSNVEQLKFMDQWWDDVSFGADRINSEQLARIIKVWASHIVET